MIVGPQKSERHPKSSKISLWKSTNFEIWWRKFEIKPGKKRYFSQATWSKPGKFPGVPSCSSLHEYSTWIHEFLNFAQHPPASAYYKLCDDGIIVNVWKTSQIQKFRFQRILRYLKEWITPCHFCDFLISSPIFKWLSNLLVTWQEDVLSNVGWLNWIIELEWWEKQLSHAKHVSTNSRAFSYKVTKNAFSQFFAVLF